MSDAIFPDLPGLKWDGTKKPTWSTKIHEVTNGKETRAAYWSYPKWFFTLAYEFLDGSDLVQELQTLGGFFLSRKGSFDSFLFRDDSDYMAEGQVLGTGDGARTLFQVIRSFGDFDEPIKNIAAGTLVVYINGAPTTAFTSDAAGLLTFTTAPATGAVISADFEFYFRCRFLKDEAEFTQFMSELWELKKLEMVSIK
jgi:uncharacterized protein (TIGR02217 family)